MTKKIQDFNEALKLETQTYIPKDLQEPDLVLEIAKLVITTTILVVFGTAIFFYFLLTYKIKL